MTKLVISNLEARRLFLHRHALGKRSSHRLQREDVLSLVRDLGLIGRSILNDRQGRGGVEYTEMAQVIARDVLRKQKFNLLHEVRGDSISIVADVPRRLLRRLSSGAS